MTTITRKRNPESDWQWLYTVHHDDGAETHHITLSDAQRAVKGDSAFLEFAGKTWTRMPAAMMVEIQGPMPEEEDCGGCLLEEEERQERARNKRIAFPDAVGGPPPRAETEVRFDTASTHVNGSPESIMEAIQAAGVGVRSWTIDGDFRRGTDTLRMRLAGMPMPSQIDNIIRTVSPAGVYWYRSRHEYSVQSDGGHTELEYVFRNPSYDHMADALLYSMRYISRGDMMPSDCGKDLTRADMIRGLKIDQWWKEDH